MTMELQAGVAFFGVLFCWSLCTFNGSNLLDGIDTFSFKYYAVSLIVMTGVSFALGFYDVAVLSLCLIAPMLGFYFYNRFPSKLHLGEIGGTLLGLNTIFLSLLFYSKLMEGTTPIGVTNYSLLFCALSFVHLPLVELGVSFLRRLFSGQKPFHGDKLHIHYLLADDLKDVSKAASILAIFHLQALGLNIALSYFVGTSTAFWLTGMFYVSYYLAVGLPSWIEAAQIPEAALYSIDGEGISSSEFDSDNFSPVSAEDEDQVA